MREAKSTSTTTEEKAEESNGASECEVDATEEMRDPEFWQRIALEAIVNDDPAKALSLRVEAYFADAKCLPRQRDTLRIRNIGHEELFEWLITPGSEFEFETIEEDTRGVIVRGIEYSQFEGEFSPEGDR